MDNSAELSPAAAKPDKVKLSGEELTSYDLVANMGRYRRWHREAQKPLTFREQPIKLVERIQTKKIEAAIGEDEITTMKFHYISYLGKEYRPEEFLKSTFPYYKAFPYKIEYKSDDIFRLGSSQRIKLSYDLLSRRFGTLRNSEQDTTDLIELSYRLDCDATQKWRKLIQWYQGVDEMLTFGYNLNVPGSAKGVWCYSKEWDRNKVTFTGHPMTWEEWTAPLIEYVRTVRIGLKTYKKTATAIDLEDAFITARTNAMSLLFCYNNQMITLPQQKYLQLDNWISDAFERDIPFPYHGDTGSDNYTFSIDFSKDSKDIEIVPSDSRSENMSKYNTEHNAERNKAQGLKDTMERFALLKGDAWTRQEILDQGFSKSNLETFLKDGLIRRVSQGHYVRNIV